MYFLLSIKATELINGEVNVCENLLEDVQVGTEILQELAITDIQSVVNSTIAPVNYCTIEIDFGEAILCGHFARTNEIAISVDKKLLIPIYSVKEVYNGIKIIQGVDTHHFLDIWRRCGYSLHITAENAAIWNRDEYSLYIGAENAARKCEDDCDSCLELLGNCPKAQERNPDITILCTCHRCAEGLQQCLDGVESRQVKKVTANIGDLYLPNVKKLESTSHGVQALMKDGSVYTVTLEIENS